MKEILIIFFIIAIVIIGTVYIDKYLNNTTYELVSNLEDLRYKIERGDATKDELQKKSEDIKSKWNEINKKWSNIILHEEIDLIETALIRTKSKIEIGLANESIEDIETAIFLINHIKEKEKTSLKNIF